MTRHQSFSACPPFVNTVYGVGDPSDVGNVGLGNGGSIVGSS